MKRTVLSLTGLMALALGLIIPTEAQAIPAFARLYGLQCSACHSAYPALNALGEGFRLSGYRRFAGGDLVPVVPPVKIGDRLELPGIVPLSVSLVTGYNFTEIHNTLGDGSKNISPSAEFKTSQSSFNLNEIELLVGTPIGRHLSFFMEAPLAETEIRQFFDPEIRAHGAKFKLEGPEVPEMVFVGIHDILVRDLLNLKGGVMELPTPFSPTARRLSFFPYLAYEANAYDVISHVGVDDLFAVPGVDEEGIETNQFRLSKTQIGVQLFGRATPSLHGIPALYVDYAVGVVNGNNVHTDNNKTKDFFGRLAATYTIGNTTLTVGGFGYYSGNTLDSLTTNSDTGARFKDRLWRAGPDLSVTLTKPIYINLFSQILFAGDSDPTGFGKKARWWGGFVEADVKPLDQLVLYGRYDWMSGRRFDNTDVNTNPDTAIGPVHPELWDVVIGAQYFLWENFKLIAEFRHGEKDLGAVTPDEEHLKKTKENAVFTGIRLVF